MWLYKVCPILLLLSNSDSVKIMGNGDEDSLHLVSNLANVHWIIHFLFLKCCQLL